MNELQMKTIGEIVDEASKRAVRELRTRKLDKLQVQYVLLANDLLNKLRVDGTQINQLWSDLEDLNLKIWDAIDQVTAFEVMVNHTPEEMKTMILTAQQVQTFNRQRTDAIRQIDALCGIESRTPEKVHKHV